MSGQRKGPREVGGPVRSNPTGVSTHNAIPKSLLQQMASSLGNQDMADRLHMATKRRDDLLSYIGARLGRMKNLQDLELGAAQQPERWIRDVALMRPGHHLPDPTRWRRPAGLYKKAAEAIATGDLARGATLLEQAMTAERAVEESVPGFVHDQEEAATTAPEAPPPALSGITAGEGCPRCALPESIRQADEILRVQVDGDEVFQQRVRGHQGWWEAEEDDDEEKPGEPKKLA